MPVGSGVVSEEIYKKLSNKNKYLKMYKGDTPSAIAASAECAQGPVDTKKRVELCRGRVCFEPEG